jgi:outer membrane protein TolC
MTFRWFALLLAVLLARTGFAQPPRKTLPDCLAIALENHPSLKAAAASVQAGNQRIRQAMATYLPQVSASYAAERQNSNVAIRTQTSGGISSQTTNFYNTGFGLSQVLFDFGQALNGIRAAQATRDALTAQAMTDRETVLLNVKQSYFAVLAAQRLLKVADETVRDNGQQLEQAQGRFRVGLAPPFDVTRAQVQLANAELNQITARNNLSVAHETLRNALGLTGPLNFELVDLLDVQALQINEADALAAAYDRRPELQDLRAQQRALDEQIAATQKNYLPFVTGAAAYNWSGSDYPLQSNWSIGANVNLSIFNGGLTTAQVGEQTATRANLKFTEEQTRQNIALEVRQAVLDLQRAYESIRVSEKAAQQARENLALAEGRYATGVGNIIELTDAETALASAEASHVQSLYSYQTAIAGVERATAMPVRPE